MAVQKIKIIHLPSGESLVGTSGEVLQKWARKKCIPLPMGAVPRALRLLKEPPKTSVVLSEVGGCSRNPEHPKVFMLEFVEDK
jgi:hypothetical protein